MAGEGERAMTKLLDRVAFFKSRNISYTAKILRLLKEKHVVTNTELNQLCIRYVARIDELRRDGHIIVTNRVGDELYEFVYHGERREKEYEDTA